jgi:hypothetical protein
MKLRVIHIGRKPLSEPSVAQNVTLHGTGGINIDGARLPTTEESTNHSRGSEASISKGIYGDSRSQGTHQTEGQKRGRFPANLILQHKPGCRCEGTKTVKGSSKTNRGSDCAGIPGTALLGSQDGTLNQVQSPGYANEEGEETVDNWVCVPGCPAYELDQQSGISVGSGGNTSGASAFGQNSGWNRHNNRPTFIHRHNDVGGASRFFKQIQ